MPDRVEVSLSLDHSNDRDFRWQIYFDRFSVETHPEGRMIHLAATWEGQAAEIISIIVGNEGLAQLRKSVDTYISGFAGVVDAPSDVEKLPSLTKRCSPVFANHVRLARSGDVGEIAFYTILLSFIGDEVNGRRKKGSPMPLVPVGVFHSSVPVHYRLMCKLLDGIKTDYEVEDKKDE